MPIRTTDDPDTVVACPECDRGGKVWLRVHESKNFDKAHSCHLCGAEFEDPVIRPPKSATFALSHNDPDALPNGLRTDIREAIERSRGGD